MIRSKFVRLVACSLVGAFAAVMMAAPNAACSGGGATVERAWAETSAPVAELVGAEMVAYEINAGDMAGELATREWLAAMRSGDRDRAVELWLGRGGGGGDGGGGVRAAYLAHVANDATLNNPTGATVRAQITRNVALLDTLLERGGSPP